MTRVTATAVILVAMDEEAAPFLAAASEVSEPVVIGRASHQGVVIGGAMHVLVRTGIGMVNAAAAAEAAVGRYGPDVVLISAGSAGGLAPDVAVGDVIVSSALVNVAADARAFGYELGQTPGMPASYEGDAELVAAAEAAGARPGAVGSGERFVVADVAVQMRGDFPSLLAVDMESAAIAQVAHNHGVPFVSVRGVSDLCAPDGTEFLTHVDDAAERSARVVLAALAR